MEQVFSHCAGIDVHKKFLVVCRRWVDPAGQLQQDKCRFSTMTDDLHALSDWLTEVGITHVAMESTGVYWQPVFNILEGSVVVWLVNSQHVKNVPGRKTDMTDCEWLAQLMACGLLKPSFIPSRPQRELRDLVRYRQNLVEERTRVVHRLQKVLEDANLKLASVVTDVQGVSAQEMLHHLVAGQEDPAQLAALARGSLRRKQTELERALRGRFTPHHRGLVAELLTHLDFADERLQAIEAQIEEQLQGMPGFPEAIERLDTLPGVSRLTAIAMLSEMGIDMAQFPSAQHLCSWCGLAPGNNESGGKRRSAKRRSGNPYLRRTMVQAAWSACKKKDSYLKSLYHRLAARRGKNRAIVAVARTLLQVAYHLIERGETYQDLGGDYLDRVDREHSSQRLVRRLKALGYEVKLEDQEEPMAV